MTDRTRIALLKGDTKYEVNNAFIDGLARGFRALGLQPLILDLKNAATVTDRVAEYFELRPCASVAINSISFQKGDRIFYEASGIPHLAFCVDHPAYQLGRIPNPSAKELHFSVVEPSHGAYLTASGVTRHRFIPHGADSRILALPETDRDIPLLFAGSVPSSRVLLERLLSELPEASHKATKEIGRRGGALTPEAAVAELLSRVRLETPSPAALRNELIARFDTLFRAAKREQILSSLKSEALWIAGDIATDIAPGPRWKVLGPLPYAELLPLYRRAKTVLHIHPFFPGGSHERVLDALLAGAAVLTEKSAWFEAALAECADAIGWYDPADPDWARPLAPSTAARAAASAFIARAHTWESRAKLIAEYILSDATSSNSL